MKTYLGQAPHRVIVQLANGKVRELDPSNSIVNHSPTGFSWGYAGSGPAQLALALCRDVLGRGGAKTQQALDVYQAFKLRMIAKLPGDQDWALTEDEVRAAIALIRWPRAELGR